MHVELLELEADEIKVKYEDPIEDDGYVPQIPVRRTIVCKAEEVNEFEITIEDTVVLQPIGYTEILVIERTHSCKKCSKIWKSAARLKAHERVHSEKRPIECTECPKKFRKSSSLKLHNLVHNEDSSFECY